jgi:hypothetical protein
MKYRQIATSFWEDGYTLKLSAIEKLFFLYLFTNPKVNMVGIYELPDPLILPILGCSLDNLSKLKLKFEADRKFFFYDGWIYINNYVKYNRYSSAPNVIKSFIDDFNKIPLKTLNYFLNNKQLNYIPTVMDKDNNVMVKVMVMDKKATPYPTIQAKLANEDINLQTDKIIDEVFDALEKRKD